MLSGPVILNNTPLVAFWVIDQLGLLRSLYREVMIPDAVLAEFLASEPHQRRRALTQAPWIKTAHLKNPHAASIFAGLDRGESEVLALAIEREARLIIMDERKGRGFARRLRLPLTGTLGVLIAAKQKGLIAEMRPFIESLQSAGLYFHSTLIAQTLQTVNEESQD